MAHVAHVDPSILGTNNTYCWPNWQITRLFVCTNILIVISAHFSSFWLVAAALRVTDCLSSLAPEA
jgi:hypothetical protein